MSAPAGAAPRFRSADQAANRRRRGGAGGGPPAFKLYAVERGFDRPGRNRGPAAGYGKLAVRYRATTRIAAIDHRLERLPNTP